MDGSHQRAKYAFKSPRWNFLHPNSNIHFERPTLHLSLSLTFCISSNLSFIISTMSYQVNLQDGKCLLSEKKDVYSLNGTLQHFLLQKKDWKSFMYISFTLHQTNFSILSVMHTQTKEAMKSRRIWTKYHKPLEHVSIIFWNLRRLSKSAYLMKLSSFFVAFRFHDTWVQFFFKWGGHLDWFFCCVDFHRESV